MYVRLTLPAPKRNHYLSMSSQPNDSNTTPPNNTERKPFKPVYSAEDWSKARQMVEAGHSYHAVQQALGMAPATITWKAKREHWTVPRRKSPLPSPERVTRKVIRQALPKVVAGIERHIERDPGLIREVLQQHLSGGQRLFDRTLALVDDQVRPEGIQALATAAAKAADLQRRALGLDQSGSGPQINNSLVVLGRVGNWKPDAEHVAPTVDVQSTSSTDRPDAPGTAAPTAGSDTENA